MSEPTFSALEQLYRTGAWSEWRDTVNDWHDWFTAKKIKDAKSEIPNKKTGKKVDLYPLGINPFLTVAEAHRDTVIGTLPNHSTLPIQIDHDRPELTAAVATVLANSDFASMLMEAVLLMEIHGGRAFKVAWEPGRDSLTYRTRLVSLSTAEVWPIYEPTDPWNLLECYIGQEIDADVALSQYGVTLDHPTGLYLEHWTRTDYRIEIDGQPIFVNVNGTLVPLAGPHKIGRVPVVCVPHIRAGEFWGLSHVEQILGMVKEMNSATLDIGDAVHAGTHPRLIGGNFRNKQPEVRPIVDESKNVVDQYIYTSDTPIQQGAQPPFLDYPKRPDVPAEAPAYVEMLTKLIQRQTRTASSALGEINFSSGRVVGTVMSSLMQPTLAHTQVERTDLATGIQHIVELILRTLDAHRADLANLGAPPVPAMTPSDVLDHIHTVITWYPPIPIEAKDQAAIIVQEVTGKTRSILSALVERGVPDPEAELQQIFAEYEQLAMIDAKAKALVAEAQAKARPAPTSGP